MVPYPVKALKIFNSSSRLDASPPTKSLRKSPKKTYLSSSTVSSHCVPQLILTDRSRCVNLVTQKQERHFREFLDREQRVELSLGFVESLGVLGIYEEDNTVDFGEVVFP